MTSPLFFFVVVGAMQGDCVLMEIASRKGGPRIELEKWSNGVPVVHNYGHAGAGYQSSW